MSNRRLKAPAPPSNGRRVAVYCRKSTSKGLEQEFNSLDAQREAIEAYVRSQAGSGWRVLPEHYDDGGFSGANTDRPAFQRLMEDVKAGRVDVIAVYKIDRLSRSLIDFAETIRTFEDCGVEFVSVTQQFSTANSMGKLTLNILMSFAEFERDVISERTRDKIAASRRRGIWTGGHPPLGYALVEKKLEIVPREAEQVRAIFELYLQLGSLGEVVAELTRRGWRGKDRVTKAGKTIRGTDYSKSKLRHLLTNVLYRGLITSGDEVFEGKHEAIIDAESFDAVRAQLTVNRRHGGAAVRNKWGMLLTGLVSCGGCGARMGHTYSCKGNRQYHYYLCPTHKTPGAEKCKEARVAAKDLESFVVDRIREVGRDPSLIADALLAAQEELQRRRPEVESELRKIEVELRRLDSDRRAYLDQLVEAGPAAKSIAARIGEVDDQSERLGERASELKAELVQLDREAIDEDEFRRVMAEFDPVWDQLIAREKQRVLSLLIEEVRFDGESSEVTIRYRTGGIQALAQGDAA